MANVTVGDLTNTPTLADDDKIEVEKADGSPCHITGEDLRASLGASSLVSIQRVTTTSSQSSVTFGSIVGTYKHLRLRVFGRSNISGADNDTVLVQFNGDTGSNYAWARDGAADSGTTFSSGSTSTTAITAGFIPGATSNASFAGFTEMEIPEYTNTSWKKMGWNKSTGKGGSGVYQMNLGWGWNNTAAITDILVKLSGSNTFVDGTVVDLIGVQW